MRIKSLFSVPDGEKVTEKALRKVLISSVCAALLCMTCLVGTTWAWFTVSIENTGNEIWIGEPQVSLTTEELPDNVIEVSIVHASGLDDLEKKSTLYVTLTVRYGEQQTVVYTTLNDANKYAAVIQIQNNTGGNCSFDCAAAWNAPEDFTQSTGVITLEAATSTGEDAGSDTGTTQETPSETGSETSADPSTETSDESAAGSSGETAEGEN